MAPTYEIDPRCVADWERLEPEMRRAFTAALAKFVADLSAGQGLRAGLRVKRVQGADGVWEMTFAPDGCATFRYGPERRQGQPHVIWRRIGTHAALR
ncbi:MAG: hypothetical protein LBG11_01405 [Bifidobacteriaceae bacterium]|jgi:hypothetical protein|nr:hypothetical protein [Bifidobacteriaceae bacterium]